MGVYQINGLEMPSPNAFEVSYKINGKEEMVASGDMVMDRLSVKRVITITYNYLEVADLRQVFVNTIHGDLYFDVTYVDMTISNFGFVTGTFRVKSITCPYARVNINLPIGFKDIKLVLEER